MLAGARAGGALSFTGASRTSHCDVFHWAGREHSALRLVLCPNQLLEMFDKEVELPSVLAAWATQRLVSCHKGF